jgi:hypothetical protein
MALDARREWLSEQLHQELERLSVHTERRAVLETQLAGIEEALAAERRRYARSILPSLRVASPCRASWDDMIGDARVRLCLTCDRNVFNLSAMSMAEADQLVREKEGQACVRYFMRADGTILTADCGAARGRRRLPLIAVASGLAAAAAIASSVDDPPARPRPPALGAQAPRPVAPSALVAPRAVVPPTTSNHALAFEPQGTWIGGLGQIFPEGSPSPPALRRRGR